MRKLTRPKTERFPKRGGICYAKEGVSMTDDGACGVSLAVAEP